jgi:hypothetical protein
MRHATNLLRVGTMVATLLGTVGADITAQSPEEQLTKARLDTDLGKYDEAARSLAGLVASPSTPPSLRSERPARPRATPRRASRPSRESSASTGSTKRRCGCSSTPWGASSRARTAGRRSGDAFSSAST